MNVSDILKYEKDASEDYYGVLGCDPSSSTDQGPILQNSISTEKFLDKFDLNQIY
jgi:hypothetical protein